MGRRQHRLAVGFYPRGDNKRQVALPHDRLLNAAMAEESKAFWTERMAVLKKMLES